MKTRKDSAQPPLAVSPRSKKPNLQIQIPEKKDWEEKVFKRKKEILGFRTGSEHLFIKDHVVQALKTSVLYNEDLLPKTATLDDIQALKKTPSYRPITKIITQSNRHSPTAVQTPNGTILPRTSRFNVMSIFSNEPKSEPITDLNNKKILKNESLFQQSESFEFVSEAESNCKTQSALITPKKLEKRRLEDYKNNFRRSISQNKIMSKNGKQERKASATDYVNATQLFDPDLRWEWLHLVAHMIDGAESQKADNLVAGTAYSNTEMMFVENILNALVQHYANGLKLTVNAKLIPGTHIGIIIEYLIQTKDFELHFEFNPQTKNRPHIHYQDYFNFLVSGILHPRSINKKREEASFLTTYKKSQIAKIKLPSLKETKQMISHAATAQKPNRQIILDTETTGLSVEDGHRVVQIAAIEMINGKLTGKIFNEIIHPDRKIPSELARNGIHQITNAVVKDKPKFHEIADRLILFIKDAELIGHNLPFDLTMIENELKLANKKASTVGFFASDTLETARQLFPKAKYPHLKSHKLDALCDFFEINHKSRDKGHDALLDSQLTAKLFNCLEKAKKEKVSHTQSQSNKSRI